MGQGADAAIRTDGLARSFGALRALRSVSLTVARGESVAVFGPNGAGKTTLIRLLTLGLRATGGTFLIDGIDPRRDPRSIRAGIGVISHQSYLYDDLSAGQNLEFYARMYGVADPRGRAAELLDAVGLAARAGDPVGTFSRGMQQRVSLARALVHEPKLVFLDEPFTGLDPAAAVMLRRMLERLREERRSVFMVTHNLAQGLELSDRWVLLERGRIAAEGPSASTDPAALERDYFDRFVEAGAR